MKTKTLIALASLSVLFVYYSTQLSQAVKSSVASPTQPVQSVSSDSVEATSSRSVCSSMVVSDNLKSTYNRFVIDNSRKVDLVGRRGTRISFPPNTFEDLNGNPVSEGIELVINECYDLSEILAEKLSTTSGSAIIETAGMINIRAGKNGAELRLCSGIEYSLSFPTKGERGDGFELFYGKRNSAGVVDWISAGQSANSNASKASVTAGSGSIQDDCFIQICESEFRRRTLVSEMDYFNWQLVGGQTLNQWFVSNFNPDAAMADDFCSDKLYSQITFHVNQDGSFKDYYISHQSKPEYDRVIADFLATMPPLDLRLVMPDYTADHACVLSFGHKQGSSNDDFIKRFVKKYDYVNPDQAMSDVNTSDLDYYMFSSTELGWINCDRFLKEDAPLVDVVVEAHGSDGATVSMVFENQKSIVRGMRNGDRFVFAGVPSNRNVRLIGLENVGGNPTMEVKRMNTAQLQCKLGSYEPLTLAKLDAAMCWK